MLKEEKNLKDPEGKSLTSYGAGSINMSITGSYKKTNKLITALYMVTDIIDKDEPLRNKLRTLGTEIISDINSEPSRICTKISEIMSFLDIASAVNIISSMNCNILRKEFLELEQSIKESIGEIKTINRNIDLSRFFKEEIIENYKGQFKGHQYSTRIGVQKGNTLMKALSDRTRLMSNNNFTNANKKNLAPSEAGGFHSGFGVLKKQRRADIINIIKIIGGNATIKDIKDRSKIIPEKTESIISCSEKTLQRELVSMVRDNVLNKTGEKRWSRYFLK